MEWIFRNCLFLIEALESCPNQLSSINALHFDLPKNNSVRFLTAKSDSFVKCLLNYLEAYFNITISVTLASNIHVLILQQYEKKV